MKHEPERVRSIVPKHVSHWEGLGFSHYLGGPFEDRSGGLIVFEADDAAAESAVLEDPFVLEALVDAHWLKRWTPE